MDESLEEKAGNSEQENPEDSIKNKKDLINFGLGLIIYWGACAGIVYLRNHTETYKLIANYFK